MLKKATQWSLEHYSHLPWRKKRTLYRTLVSEIMLQQTTVSTVLNHFERFLEVYPDLETLAAASEEEITVAWKGLGYYRRARNLRNAAEEIVKKYNGKIPLERNELVKIKGIGDYTAGALMAIGANKKALAIDANIERVLSRLYCVDAPKGPKLHRELRELFEKGKILRNIGNLGPREVHEALMDVGRDFCGARSSDCILCPLSNKCQALKNKKVHEYPRGQQKKVVKFYDLKLLRVVVSSKKGLLVYKKGKNEWLSGQLELPTYVVDSEDQNLSQYQTLRKEQLKLDIKNLPTIKTNITKYRITNYILRLSENEFKDIFKTDNKYYFVKGKPLKLNLSTASLKALKKKELI